MLRCTDEQINSWSDEEWTDKKNGKIYRSSSKQMKKKEIKMKKKETKMNDKKNGKMYRYNR